ncbi:MAG: (d)CMP kinase [Oscillospiraceae bacterium]|nr:(d)CMP kinase [Oscillospiraceae bacterium]
MNIAIDGPSGAGKSTLARLIAKKMGYVYIDTGAMYRAAALKMINLGLDVNNDADGVIKAISDTDIEISHLDDGQHIFLDKKDVTSLIRTPDVSMGASAVATIKEVRLKLVEMQRKIAQKCNCIMDGRDIGTYVLPDADIKIFLTASAEERAKRRYAELLEKGENVSYDVVWADIIKRDKNDSERTFAPLKVASDSIKVDTSKIDLDESVRLIEGIILDRMEKNYDFKNY